MLQSPPSTTGKSPVSKIVSIASASVRVYVAMPCALSISVSGSRRWSYGGGSTRAARRAPSRASNPAPISASGSLSTPVGRSPSTDGASTIAYWRVTTSTPRRRPRRLPAHGAVRDDRLPAREHGDERRDLSRAPGGRFHCVGAEREREEVQPVERAERPLRTRVGRDGRAQVARDGGRRRCANRSIRGVPAAVGLRGVDRTLAMGCHAPSGDEPRDVLAVDLAPPALASARRVPLQERPVVETLAQAVDPAPTQDDVERLRRRDRWQP